MKTVVGLFPSDRQLLSEILDDLARKTIPLENISTARSQRSQVLEDAGKGALTGAFAGLAIGAATLLIPVSAGSPLQARSPPCSPAPRPAPPRAD